MYTAHRVPLYQARFLSVLPVVGTALAPFVAGALLVVVGLAALVAVLLAAGAVLVVLEVAVVFLTTVAVLASLDSLVTLTFRLPRVAVVDGGGAAALRVRPVAVVAVVPTLELAVEEAVAFLVTAAGRVALALSIMLDRMLEEALVVGAFMGDAGRLIIGFEGEAGRSLGITRVFDDVGDRTCDVVTGGFIRSIAARSLFFGLSIASP